MILAMLSQLRTLTPVMLKVIEWPEIPTKIGLFGESHHRVMSSRAGEPILLRGIMSYELR